MIFSVSINGKAWPFKVNMKSSVTSRPAASPGLLALTDVTWKPILSEPNDCALPIVKVMLHAEEPAK
jgi:hypothetical protein